MTKWVILVVFVAAVWMIWKWLPIGKVHGRKITPSDLTNSNTRLLLQLSRARAALDECMKYPPHERLEKLLAVESRHGTVFLAGEEIRTAMVATGVDGAVPHFTRILRMRHGGLSITSGLEKAVSAGAMEDGYRVNAFKFLIDGLGNRELFSVSSKSIPGLLLELDEDWAARILQEICEHEPDHYLFLEIFQELDARGLLVNPAVTERVLSGGNAKPMSRDQAKQRIAAALSLHDKDPVRSEKLLEDIMEAQPDAAGDAAEALLEAKDLPHPIFLLDDLKHRSGFNALSEAEKTVWLAVQCGYYLRNDYLYRFDSEEEGDQLREMRDAVARVGAKKTAALLEAYMNLYGPDGPSATTEERREFARSKGEEWERQVSELAEKREWDGDILTLAMQYELRHGGEFHKASEIRKIIGRPQLISPMNR